MGAEYCTFRSQPGNRNQFGSFPGIRAHEQSRKAHLTRLLHEQGGIAKVTRGINCLGILDGGELGGKVLVSILVGCFSNNSILGSGEFLPGLPEESSQPHRVILGDVLNNRDLCNAVFNGILCHHATLEGIDEAGAEIILLAFRDKRIGGGAAHHRDARFFGDFTTSHRVGGAIAPNYGNCLFLFNQTGHGCGSFRLVTAVVHQHHPDRNSQDFLFLFICKVDALHGLNTTCSLGTGHGFIDTNHNFGWLGGLSRFWGASSKQSAEDNQRYQQADKLLELHSRSS